MKEWKRLIALILCLCMVCGLFGCQQQPAADAGADPTDESTESTPAETEPDELDSLREAIAAVQEASNLTLNITTAKTVTVGGETFTEQSSQTLICAGLGTEDPRYSSTEKVDFGSGYYNEYTEIYVGGTLYLTVDNDYSFQGQLTAEEAAARYLPAVLVDPALYGSYAISGNDLTFTEPTAGEIWAIPEGAELTEATATAQLTSSGTLRKTGYTVTYTYGNAEITLEAEVKVAIEDAANISVEAPEDPDSYLLLTDIDAPRMMENAVGHLYGAKTFSSLSMQSIVSHAAGIVQNQSTQMYIYDVDGQYNYKREIGVYVYEGYYGSDYEYDYEETFVDGVLSYSEDGGDPEESTGVSASYVRSYYDNLRAYEILTLDNWQDAVITDLGTLYLIELDLTEEWSQGMQSLICENWWGDGNFLMDLADSYADVERTSYVGIDKYTGLPTSTGYYYEGCHTLEGEEYTLSYQLDQSFEAPCLGAYKEINDEMLPEQEPEQTPTPLFYHVTGPDGQEMWLFGTIHVGNDASAYLPQEIYDALAASDALAIECDNDGFEELYDSDESIQDAVSDAYYYSGSTIQDHIDPELYEIAVKYMKATGSYNMNSNYAKPYLWYESIDDFYLRQGYQLTRDQGIEERLTTFAEDNEIPLWEVESCLFQIQMLTGFSDELQEWMLEGSVEYSDPSFWEGSTELFELWCSGDEAALRERISCEVDTSELTEEELAEYEEYKALLDEYNDSISHSRNDGMLEVLKGYLESGDTVFVAVGLAHLLDETNGLVDTLRAAGYTVEQVEFAGN